MNKKTNQKNKELSILDLKKLENTYQENFNKMFEESTKKFNETLEKHYKLQDKEKEFTKAICILEKKIKKLKEKSENGKTNVRRSCTCSTNTNISGSINV